VLSFGCLPALWFAHAMLCLLVGQVAKLSGDILSRVLPEGITV
jgi:hypothetical protein